MRNCLGLALLIVAAAVTNVNAQTAASAQRADGASVPLMVYGPAKTANGACAPVILFSPGLGGTERGYAYFGNGIAEAGYRVLVMGHKESGPQFLRGEIRGARSIRGGIVDAVADRTAENDRLLDVDAALKYADTACRAPLVVLAGHSMGAVTAMLQAGARNHLNIAPSAAAARITAYVALSPEGAGPVFEENAWSGIGKPVLMMTGTRDQGSAGNYRWRMTAYDGLPKAGGAHWLGVVDGATHMDFARNAETGAGARVIQATTAFLQCVRAGEWSAPPPPLSGVTWQTK